MRRLTGRELAALAALAVAFAALYRDVVAKLVHDWGHDDNYSHGFLIVPIALYFAWERRERLLEAPPRPSLLGLVVVLGSVVDADRRRARRRAVPDPHLDHRRDRPAAILFVLGWQHLRVLAFPLAFLLLMIPIPAIIFNQIAFPLQLLASRFGETTLQAVRRSRCCAKATSSSWPTRTLEVAEACSGIRSLISLLTLGIVYGYFTDPA